MPFDLRRARLARGLSQEALADLSGVSRAQIQRIQKAPSAEVRTNTQALLARALGVCLAITGEPSSPPMPFAGASLPEIRDARAGLTDEVLDGLRRAERVVLAAKDARTGILGHWVGPNLTVALIAADPLFTLMRRAPRQMAEQPTRVAVHWSTPSLHRRGVRCSEGSRQSALGSHPERTEARRRPTPQSRPNRGRTSGPDRLRRRRPSGDLRVTSANGSNTLGSLTSRGV
jgi:transcriptional regulator with XRE-family HTH domain